MAGAGRHRLRRLAVLAAAIGAMISPAGHAGVMTYPGAVVVGGGSAIYTVPGTASGIVSEMGFEALTNETIDAVATLGTTTDGDFQNLFGLLKTLFSNEMTQRQALMTQAVISQSAAGIIASNQIAMDGSNLPLRAVGNCGSIAGTGSAASSEANKINAAGDTAGSVTQHNAQYHNQFDALQEAQTTATHQPLVASANIIGDASGVGGTGGVTTTPDSIQKHIDLVTNPVPLPTLPPGEAGTPAGKEYATVQAMQLSSLSVSQSTLAGIASFASLPTENTAWTSAQLAGMGPVGAKLAAALSSNTGANSVDGNGHCYDPAATSPDAPLIACPPNNATQISQQMMYYVLVQSRIANPVWQKKILTSTTDGLLQEEVLLNAVRAGMEYQTMVLTERMAAMMAETSANRIVAQTSAAAGMLRQSAMSQRSGK